MNIDNAISNNTKEQIDILGDAAIVTVEWTYEELLAKEDNLGAPLTDGQVLVSLIDGTRAWSNVIDGGTYS